MKFRNFSPFMALAFLFISWCAEAQEKPDREIEIRKNVKLILASIPADTPEDVASQYQSFLPILQEALKENTKDEADECALTLRVSVGIKEIGSGKVKRAQARLTAFRRNSKQEYVGSLILYSYITSGPVNKDETVQFLKRQILEPSECHPAER